MLHALARLRLPALAIHKAALPSAWASAVAGGVLAAATLASCPLEVPGPATDAAAVVPPQGDLPLPPAERGPAVAPCLPSGRGTDYQVGPGGGQIASLDQVPWESLQAGDTVRIFYREAPYAGKLLIMAAGTADAPVRVCGVKGPGGERPVVDGAGAVTRRALVYGGDYAGPIQQARAVVMIMAEPFVWTAFPSHVQVDGLAIRGAHPDNSFTDTGGAVQRYADFGACVWIDRGHDITIADNEISGCAMGVFSRSSDDGAFAQTRGIRLVGNSIHGNGIVGSDRVHNTYMQSVGMVYEFNHYGPLREGALGNAIKDRSVGTVLRYNRIEEGAHALDLVEAEDYPLTALADPAYRRTWVYGNQIVKNGSTGTFVHYGGDHYGSEPGANWGEPLFRKGTLYFYNNTVLATGSSAALFQLSTTEEHAQAWNNVVFFAPSVTYPSLRASSGTGAAWTPGGVLTLGRNWLSGNWADADPWHPVPGQLLVAAPQLTGTAMPVDACTLVPLADSPVIDAGLTPPELAAVGPPLWQLDGQQQPVPRDVHGGAVDLGAVER